MLFTLLNRQRRDRGFSFVELLAYMAIAALLILAAIPQFSSYREKALVSNMANDVHNASLAVEAARIDLGAKGGGGTMQLASTASTAASTTEAATVAALTATVMTAIATVKTSDAGTTISSRSITASDYVLVATNPKTKNMAVFSSGERAPLTLSPGVHIRKTLPNDPAASDPTPPPLSSTPTATAAAVSAAPVGGTVGAIAMSPDGKIVYGAGFNLNALDVAKGTWTKLATLPTPSVQEMVANDGGTVFTMRGNKGVALNPVLRDGVRQDYTVTRNGYIAASGDGRVAWHLLDGKLYRVANFGTASQASETISGAPALLSANDQMIATNYTGETIVAMDTARNIVVSRDSGATWTAGPRTASYTFTDLKLSRDGLHIAAAMGNGAFLSHDGGASWATLAPPAGVSGFFESVALSDDGRVVYGVIKYATYATTTGGASWVKIDATNSAKVATSADGRSFVIKNNGSALTVGKLD